MLGYAKLITVWFRLFGDVWFISLIMLSSFYYHDLLLKLLLKLVFIHFIYIFFSLDTYFAKCLFKPFFSLIILYANLHHLANLNSLLH